MKIYRFLTIMVCFFAINGYSEDIEAITKSGERVLLKDDGTWEKIEEVKDTIMQSTFEKSITATSSVETRIGTIKFWYDKTQWFVEKLTGEAAEYQFVSQKGDIYARIITEKMTFPIELMRKAIDMNAKKTATSIEVIEESVIIVNGIEISTLKEKIVMNGMELIFLWYYFSNEKGTFQLFTYTSDELFSKNNERILEFMSGITY